MFTFIAREHNKGMQLTLGTRRSKNMITIMEKNVGSGQGTLRKLYGEAPKKLGLATVEVTWLPIIIPLAT
jgi:hypothetical protein